MADHIHVVTDSTAYINSGSLSANPNVHVVPLTVNCGGTIMEDWVSNNVLFKEALDKLGRKGDFPTTSQPAPGKFVEVFSPLVEKGCEIIVITISSRLSGTFESASTAAAMVGPDKISVIDSLSTAGTQKMLVEDAVKAAADGRNRQEITTMLEAEKQNKAILLIPASLEYLRRGGRIGGASALVGTLLNIKPVLCVKDGVVDAMDKVRTQKRAYMRMVEEVPADSPRVMVAHFEAETEAKTLESLLKEKVTCDVEIVELGPVIATHVGPGVLGLLFERT